VQRNCKEGFMKNSKSISRNTGNRSKAVSISLDELNNICMEDIRLYCQNELKWALARLGYYLYVIIGMLTGGLTVYLLAPIGSYIFFGSWNCFPYIKYFPKMLRQGYRFVWMMIVHPESIHFFQIGLSDPPMPQPDQNEVRISKNWDFSEKQCAGCIICCKKLNCPLIDKNGDCLSYQSFY